MLNKLQNEWRRPIIFVLLIMMMASLFISRALLSSSMIAFVVFSFFHPGIKDQVKQFFSSPVLWGMSLLFILPLLSGLWTEDKNDWFGIIIIKLPLLFLPLAFAGPFSFSKNEWEWLSAIFIFLVTVGTLWSLFQYASNMTAVQEGYLRAKSMITPLENDHVRFSWLVSVAVLLAMWLWTIKRKDGKIISWFLSLVIIWMILFLHILAARTGLFSFYGMMLFTALRLILQKKGRLYAAAILMVLVALPFVAYFLLPTFRNRVKYFLYDMRYAKETHYLPGSNDAVRVISWKAGWNILQEHPLKGVGFGDILAETKKWDAANYPDMIERDKIYPGSEWLVYGAGVGWPGLMLFTFIMIIPFFISVKNRMLWWLLNMTAAFSFLFDIGLEVQWGVFIYSFIILWWWKWLAR